MKISRRTRLEVGTRPVQVAVVAGLLAALTLTLAPTTGSAAALVKPSPGTLAGSGFDICDAPNQSTMTAWRNGTATSPASPYLAVGIYIGGDNRFCNIQANLTPTWVATQQAAGWRLLPIYLGLQPYCTTSSKILRFTAANASAMGRLEAGIAVERARALGLAGGSTIFNDIEAYDTTSPTATACRDAVLRFQSAWTSRLHDLGFLSGLYSSLGSGIKHQVLAYNSTSYVRPDYIWFARYNGNPTVLDTDTPQTLPNSFWLHRRIHQYRSPTVPTALAGPETWGGKTMSVDRNAVDVVPMPFPRFGDFTRNGWSDLITRDTSTGSLYLYPGNGTRFGARSLIGTGWNAMTAITRLGDFTGDGREDVIARESATGALWLYPFNGTPRIKIGGRGWNAMREITPVGDLDQDGNADLLAVQTSTGKLFFYPGRGTSLATRQLVGIGWNAMSELAGVGYFNSDGRVDLLARHTATGNLWLYPGAGAAFGARTLIGSGWNTVRDLAGVGDFDRDGFADLIAVDTSTGALFRYPGRGTSFGPRVPIGTGWAGMRPLL